MNIADISADAAIATARQRSGLDDFGSEEFLEVLPAYVEGLRENAINFNERGAAMAYEEVVGALQRRLDVQEYLRLNPAVEQEEISRPVFITGLYRSATTRLQGLLCSDPRFQYLETWKTQRPLPMPGAGSAEGGEDARIGLSRTALRFFASAAPHAMAAHPLTATDPSEEFPFLTFSFRVLDAKQSSLSFAEWLKKQDKRPMYRDLRRMLQVLQFQFKKPGLDEQRYCLKAPQHLGNLDALLDVFPDARIIVTHRDPFPAIHSFTQMRESLRGIYTDHVDPVRIGNEILDQSSTALDNFLGARSRLGPGHFLDFSFHEIVTRLFERIDDIYDFIGAPLTPEVREELTRVDSQRDEHRSRARSQAPGRYGLSPQRVHARNAAYMQWAKVSVGELVPMT